MQTIDALDSVVTFFPTLFLLRLLHSLMEKSHVGIFQGMNAVLLTF